MVLGMQIKTAHNVSALKDARVKCKQLLCQKSDI